MKISAKIFPWDKPSIYDSGNWSVAEGDIVIVDSGSTVESALVEKINIQTEEDAPKIIRKATLLDIETIERNKQKEKEAIKVCRELIKEKELPMKVVSAHYSFDGGKITFPFISDRRVDFRELVKALSKKFQRSIRLQQIGSRDEARKKGGFGTCGRELCCIKFSGDLKSVTTDDVKVQQMERRGSDSVSGLCGRLKCCLGFESEQYRKMLENMPEVGEIVKFEGKKGIVVERNILEKEVTIEFEDKSKKKVPLQSLSFPNR